MCSKLLKFKRQEEREENSAGNSVTQAAAEAFADNQPAPAVKPVSKVDVPNEGKRIAPTDIFKIWADAQQPRKSVPSAARGAWIGNPNEVGVVLDRWRALAQAECGRPLDLEALLIGQIEVHRPETGPLASYLDLVDLATALRSVEGNSIPPANIVRVGGDFILEFGERRWLAHHLLFGLFPHENWGKIPAVEVKEINVWRQAAENGARQNLNAIGKARQLAILIMDLLARTKNVKFCSFEQTVPPGECDRAFYAQVADGEQYRLPRGSSGEILAVTGLKSAEQIRQYRGLLNLPDPVWTKADDENWEERRIRDLTDEEVAAVVGDTVTEVTVSKPRRKSAPKLLSWHERAAKKVDERLASVDAEAQETIIQFWEARIAVWKGE